MLPTLLADKAHHIRGIGPVLRVLPASGHQGGLEHGRSLLVGLGEPPDLVSGQAEAADYLPEGLAAIDNSKELPPRLDG
jgi:hypothetical protein